jgi:uncharacterized protein (TIGR01244 family)
MERFTNRRVFFGAILIGVLYILGSAAYAKRNAAVAAETPRANTSLKTLTDFISVSEQLKLDQITSVREGGYATIIDLRPDGEAEGQPDAASMKAAAMANKLNFIYVPVPHGDIPDSAVEALGKALDDNPGPILLYCRSGRRAARTWSLVEASRYDGMDANAILAAVKASGQSADDLRAAIEARISKRTAKLAVGK